MKFVIGCNKSPSPRAAPKPLSQMTGGVALLGDKYFRVPYHSTGSIVTKPWDYKNKVEASGLMDYPVGNAIVVALSAKKRVYEANSKHRNVLSPAELKIYDNHPTKSPKSDSKKYKELVSTLTKMYRNGTIACYKPLTASEVKKYKEYMKVQNDPRVVAARINAQAAQQRQMMQYVEYSRARKAQSMQSMTNSLNQFSNNMVARQPVRVDVNVNHSYGNDHTYQVNTAL